MYENIKYIIYEYIIDMFYSLIYYIYYFYVLLYNISLELFLIKKLYLLF